MGKRGPRPVPTEILKFRGSWRGDINKNEPKPDLSIPECPAWLDADAKEVWHILIPILHRMRVLTIADVFAVTRYCQLHSRWRQAEIFIQKNGSAYPEKTESGRLKGFTAFPQVGIAAKLANLITRLECELGLTPSARSRIDLEVSAPLRVMSPEDQRKLDFFRREPRVTKPRRPRAQPQSQTPPPTGAAG